MAERKGAPAAVTGATNCFSINHLLGASPCSQKSVPDAERTSGTVAKNSESASTRIVEKGAAACSSESNEVKIENDLFAALQATTRLQPDLSVSLSSDATTFNFLKHNTVGSLSDRKAMNAAAAIGFEEKSLLSSTETSIPLWLNCAATATALPFEQSFLMAQRSGKPNSKFLPSYFFSRQTFQIWIL